MDPLEKLVAKSEIEDCLKRYARGIDRRDWAAVRACFHDDAIDRHGEFHGNGDAFIEWVSARHVDVPFAMHYLANCLIEFLSDTAAAVETYFWAIQRRETRGQGKAVQGTDYEVFGRYVDRFERRGEVWRIADRKVVYDSTRQQPSSNQLRQIVGVIGRRDREDPVFGLRPTGG